MTDLAEQKEKAVLLILRESLLAQTHLSIFTNSLLVKSISSSKLLFQRTVFYLLDTNKTIHLIYL